MPALLSVSTYMWFTLFVLQVTQSYFVVILYYLLLYHTAQCMFFPPSGKMAFFIIASVVVLYKIALHFFFTHFH